MIVNAVFVIVGLLGSLASGLIYGLRARWWRNPIGRLLVIKDVGMSLVYIKTVISLVVTGVVSATATSTAINIAVALLMVYTAVTYHWVLKRTRQDES